MELEPGIELDDCICSFFQILGDWKAPLTAVLGNLVVLLTTLKAIIELFNIDLEDIARRLVAEAALVAVQQTIDPIDKPFSAILGYTRAFADCDPAVGLARTLKSVRDKLLAPAYTLQYEIEQFLLELEAKDREVEAIGNWITTIQDLQKALELCGDPNV